MVGQLLLWEAIANGQLQMFKLHFSEHVNEHVGFKVEIEILFLTLHQKVHLVASFELSVEW